MFKLKTVLNFMTLRYFHKKTFILWPHTHVPHIIHDIHTYMTYRVLHKNKQKWMRVVSVQYRKI